MFLSNSLASHGIASQRAAEIVLLLSAGLAFACGGRGADSMQQLPVEPAGSVTSRASPGASPASTSAVAALAPGSVAAGGSSSPSGCSRDAADYIIMGSSEACASRELPECPDGSSAFVDACGCGCSSVARVPRECRTSCTRTGFCEASSFEDFPEFAGTLSVWQEDLQSSLEFSGGGWLIEGACAGERRFISRNNHFVWQAYVFNSAGAFLAFGTQTDDLDETCGGASYYPVPIRCADATITRVWTQDSVSHLKAGDPLTLPSSRW